MLSVTARTSSAPESRASCTARPADLETAVVVPDEVRRPRRQPAPPEHLLPRDLGTRERGDRAPQRGRRGGAPVGEDERQSVQQQVARERGARPGRVRPPRRGRRRPGCPPPPPAGRRTALRPTRRGTCRARGARRAPRASSRPGAAAPGRRDRASWANATSAWSRSTRARRARRAARPPRSPAGHGRRRTPPPPGLPARLRAPGRLAARDRLSARPRGAGTRRRPREPPRACARPADSSSSRATSSSGPAAAAARCHARRSGSTLPVRRLRQRRWAARRSCAAGGPVDGRAGQRMAEGHAFIERQQPVRRVDRGERDPEALAGALQEQRIADRLGRRDEQQTPASPGGPRAAGRSSPRSGSRGRWPPAPRSRRPAASASSPAAARAARAGSPASPRGSGRAPARPGRTRTVELSRARASPSTRPRTSSSGRCRSSSPAHAPRTRTRPARPAAARDERERERRGLIQPLRVVDDAQQRALLGHLGDEAEHGEADQEAIRRRPGLSPKTIRSASRCGPGSRSSRSSNGAQS